MPWGFLATWRDEAPFLDVLELLEEVEFLLEAPFLCVTRGFKFFEVFLELGLVVFFMRAGAGFHCNAENNFVCLGMVDILHIALIGSL